MLTFNDWAELQTGRIATVHHELASLVHVGGMFIMAGPSGVHTLQGHSTDLDRLNAHWAGFTADTRNRMVPPTNQGV
jgi:hypothetical protein